MKAREALIAWTPVTSTHNESAGQVGVGPLRRSGEPDWSRWFSHTGGAAFIATREMKGAEAKAQLFIEFHTLVVRDGIDPQAVHREFLKIDEYVTSIAPDIDGAKD